MKLLFILPGMGSGGAERVVSVLANRICTIKGNIVKILSFTYKKPFYELDDRIDYIYAGASVDRANIISSYGSMLLNIPRCLAQIRSCVDSFCPDILFPVLPAADILTYMALRSKYSGFTVVNTECTLPSSRPDYINRILTSIYRHSDLLICQSDHVARFFSSVPNKIILQNPIDISKLPPLVEETDPIQVVSVGRLSREKNFGLLISAFASVINTVNNNIYLTIYGEGSERSSLERLIHSLKLEDHVFLPGNSKNVLKEISSAAIYVTSSDYEGSSNALQEAMLTGLPVITTDCAKGGIQDLITETRGIIVPCNDQEALTIALEKLVSDKSFRMLIRHNNSAMRKDPMFSSVTDQWVNALHSLHGR